MIRASASPLARRVFMVLSPRSLPYARLALKTLFAHCDEALDLHLITDSAEDAHTLTGVMEEIGPAARHHWSVTGEDLLLDAEASHFAGLDALRAFRRGHPCWRKITDPLLLSAPGEELVLLDPDLYFPGAFRFEPTPADGLLLMWQRPNCLLPAQVVRAAMEARIPLARHVDIGVSHWRAGADLDWLNWLIARLGGADLPRIMHVEAIVWSALAMHISGGHLDPRRWVCWHRTQGKRLRRKLGAGGPSLLAGEPWSAMKCFHAGGEAKWWLTESLAERSTQNTSAHLEPGPIQPFVELTPSRYQREQNAKHLLRTVGYYRIFGSHSA